jgi:endonuclease/exonuclease/phosphatase (EEP) superfamily protein YafD
LLSANIIYLSTQIIPFTPLGSLQVLKAYQDIPGQSLCIMIANVFQDNTNTKGCLKEIAKYKPDIVLLLETNKRWDNETAELAEFYPYQVKVPLENTYGMLLYSKLKLEGTEVKYMVEEGIPSIHTVIGLESGVKVKLFAVHPTPPVPNENPRSTERDKELLLVADLAKASDLPVIVIGDLNDVAWSYTTELFLKMSGLIDPRRGRGFYNSFHAHYPFLRFPLDHAFISTDFKLKGIKRLSNFNSDHFPIYINLQYEKKASEEQESMTPDAEDVEIAAEKKAAV